MDTSKIDIGIIIEAFEKSMKTDPVFETYNFEKYEIQNLSNPTKIVRYIFKFISNERQVIFHLNDFYSHITISAFVRNLKDISSNKFDIELYCIGELKNKTIKQKLIFRFNTVEDLKKNIGRTIDFLIKSMDEKLKKIILGEDWIDMPFEWGNYK